MAGHLHGYKSLLARDEHYRCRLFRTVAKCLACRYALRTRSSPRFLGTGDPHSRHTSLFRGPSYPIFCLDTARFTRSVADRDRNDTGRLNPFFASLLGRIGNAKGCRPIRTMECAAARHHVRIGILSNDGGNIFGNADVDRRKNNAFGNIFSADDVAHFFRLGSVVTDSSFFRHFGNATPMVGSNVSEDHGT